MKEVKTPLYLCAANNSPFDLINKGKWFQNTLDLIQMKPIAKGLLINVKIDKNK